MIRKFLKSGLAVILALLMIGTPYSFAYAEETAQTAQNQTVDDAGDLQKIADSKANILTAVYGETSLQYALIDNGEVVLSGHAGVNSKDGKLPLSKDTMYGIGSISKMYTTAAVLQLADRGKVKLDNPVVKYIPEFKMADARYKKITVRMLINHSSGLMGGTLSNTMLFEDNDTISHDSFLKTLSTQRLKADPGEFSVYCNDGYTLAEILVEKVSGISFTEYIEENITKPLSLMNTKTPMDITQRDQLAKIYYAGDTMLPSESLNAIGAGGIYSTAEDLCRFAEVFMDNSGSTVLSEASAKATANKEYLQGSWYPEADSSLSYGLGWDSVNTYPFTDYGIKALVKGGDTAFYHGS